MRGNGAAPLLAFAPPRGPGPAGWRAKMWLYPTHPAQEEITVADQPVTAPDQHKPGFPKAARVGAIITIVILLLMLLGNHKGDVESLWLLGTAVVIALALIADVAMRRSGIKR